MIVFVAGMMRSGSTFSFNVVRELLSSRGSVYADACNSIAEVVEQSQSADHVIVKSHDGDTESLKLVSNGTIPAICTWRKPVDAIASWIDTFGFDYEQSLASYRAWHGMFIEIKDKSLLLSYEDIEHKRTDCVRRIADHILRDVTDAEVTSISSKFSKANAKAVADRVSAGGPDVVDIGFSQHDRVTFLHRRHVSSLEGKPAEERIPLAMIARIQRDFADILDEAGNLAF